MNTTNVNSSGGAVPPFFINPCLISFASNGRENYNEAMLNLIRSCQNYWCDDYLFYSFDGWVDEYLDVKINQMHSVQYPQPKEFIGYNHQEIPYHFKPAIFQIAREKGYKEVIWCDSTVRMIDYPYELLKHAKKYGICVFENLGHPLKNWISDVACEAMEISNEELESMKQIMACVIIFDFSNPIGIKIFEEWESYRDLYKDSGSKREGFKAHRHDQAILSVICNRRNIPFLPYGYLVYPPHHETKEYGDNIYFLNKGIK